MFKFFKDPKWFLWAYLGTTIILSSLWIQVQIDVQINEWFGDFYDMIQEALAEPYAITIEEYWASLLSFITLAGMYVAVAVLVGYFTNHFLFRWRTAMVEWYHSVYDKARKIEGASQRVQEDTIKFSRIMESLGTSLIEALMILVEFMPILFGLSIGIPIFFFGEWEYGLVVGALLWSIGGTLFLVGLGLILRLVGVEYDLQKQEAAYRKMLVIAEDDETVRPKTLEELFNDVRQIHFLSYIRYLYFDIGRIAFLQANVLSAYVFLAPAIVAGVVTLGVMQQIIRAFGRVEGSMQYLLKAWPTIIELASVYKRLREFESKIDLLQIEESSLSFWEKYKKHWEKYKKQWTENKWTLSLWLLPLILLIFFSINQTETLDSNISLNDEQKIRAYIQQRDEMKYNCDSMWSLRGLAGTPDSEIINLCKPMGYDVYSKTWKYEPESVKEVLRQYGIFD